MTTKLRPYQKDIIDDIRAALKAGHRNILVQSPTGSGKSLVFRHIISGANAKKKNVLFLVHRRNLVNQASEHMDAELVVHGKIMAGEGVATCRVQLASVDTIRSRAMGDRAVIDMPPADVVIIDEAHRVGSKTYDMIFEHYRSAIIIGVTATPARGDGKGLGRYFGFMVKGPTVRRLMDDGYLAEARYMVPHIPNLTNVKTARGDYVEKQLAGVMNDALLIGDIVQHWLDYADNRQTIAFGVNVAHSRAIAKRFSAAGISSAHIDGRTPQNERDEIMGRYVRGEVKILSNCSVFTEGFDMPQVGCVILAKPTKSLIVHLQTIGRGLRPQNGDYCLILDHSGNVLRHGPADENHDWSLEDTDIADRDAAKKERETKEAREFICRTCGNIFKRQHVCPKCGAPLAEHVQDVETARGELVELKKDKKPLKKSIKKQFTKVQKQEWWSMYLHQAADKGYRRGWASHKYRDKFGVWPKGLTDVPKNPSNEFVSYMKYQNIRRAKSMQEAYIVTAEDKRIGF